MTCSRRTFLKGLLTASLAATPLVRPSIVQAFGEDSKLEILTLQYPGEQWNGRLDALRRLSWEMMKRTSIEMKLSHRSVTPAEDRMFDSPLIYMWGNEAFAPWPEEWHFRLQRHLTYGGTLIIDSDGSRGSGFDQSVRREMEKVLPAGSFKRLDPNHTLYKSFYLLSEQGGRIAHTPYIEGIDIDDRSAVLYTQNDLGGAWARDAMGNWLYDITPGGERQREMAFRMGVNMLMYATCVNYKSDQVHIPFILKRRR